jgi:Cu2+-exporting ATPase
MDVPVSLGILAAFGASAVATWRGTGEVYFDTVSMFIFLLLCSRYMEVRARKLATENLERLQQALPASALHIAGYPDKHGSVIVAASQLKKLDVILVRPGDIFAADGVIVEGSTSIDASLLTGESRPLSKCQGDSIPGGAVNTGQAVYLSVSRPSGESSLASLIKLAESAGREKPALAQWADKVAENFIAALLLFALCVLIAWHYIAPDKAWPAAIAVLVVSCPCALSLATPVSLAMANAGLLKRGVLVLQPHVMEALSKSTHVVFDKTGTLTKGKPGLMHVECYGAETTSECLRIAAVLEAASTHPLAQTIIDAAAIFGANDNTGLTVADRHEEPGQGLQAAIAGTPYRLGSQNFVSRWVPGTAEASDRELTSIYLARRGTLLARFDVGDTLRDDAVAVVEALQKQGKQVIILSGDRQATVDIVANRLGIEQAYGDRLPAQKLQLVQELQRQGAVVAMLGDGINDAAVLRAADVSLAMGNGTVLAQASADAVLLSGRLPSFLDALAQSARTVAVVRQNLVWASLYNLAAIPAAALGYLSPWISGAGMALSSALVVANALRLQRMAASEWDTETGSDSRPIVRADQAAPLAQPLSITY